jgi:hypothetical protein
MHVMTVIRRLFAAIALLAVALGAQAALLGVQPGVPNTFFNSVGVTTYNAGTQQFSVSAKPLGTQFVVSGPSFVITGAATLTINAIVNNSGNLVGGVPGHDFVMTGTVSDGVNTYTGTLLTGEVTAFGFLNVGTTDFFDFRFTVTGGTMAGLFAGKDIGVSYASEGSSFTGSFAVNFGGGAKGNVGPIPPLTVCTGKIGDFVWNDSNQNGIQDPGEPGINGVTLTLNGPGGPQVTVTGNNPVGGAPGYYQFTDLCAGTYTVTVTPPPGMTPSPTNQGGDAGLDSNPNPATVILPTNNSEDQTIDFGFYTPCLGTIGDFVWLDANRNNVQDPGEMGLQGLLVQLVDPVTNTVIQTTITGPNGFYLFTGLCGGNYRVVFPPPPPPPPGFPPLEVCTPNVGGNPALDSNPNPSLVTLPDDNSNDLTIDHCYKPVCTGKIGDFVWFDTNRNGIQDPGETGIDGVTVRLRDSFNVVIGTTTTGPNGFYQFGGLCAGNYSVVVDETTLPPGLQPSPTLQGGDTAKDSNPNPAPVNLPADNASDQTIDFGYNAICTGKIGDFVWLDANLNGIQDVGEAGVAGVTVELRRASDNFLLATSITDANGKYLFDGLCAGDYRVNYIPPSGYSPTEPNAPGSTPANDSNPNPSDVTLPADNTVNLTIDFGLIQAQFICIPDPNGVVSTFGALSWVIEANGDVSVFFNLSTLINDNSYGTGSVGWGANAPTGKSHAFKDLLGSDNAQFRFKDANGNVKLDIVLDYIGAKSGTPSGYASLGAAGGDGKVVAGSAAHVLSWNTSLAKNLNNFGYCTGGNCNFGGINVTVNSPPTVSPTSYNLPAGSPFGNWIFPIQYEMRIAAAAFGAAGFGSVQLVGMHNSPPKIGSNLLTPVPCPGDPQPPTVFCQNKTKPKTLELKYTGGTCASSNNTQGSKSSCTDSSGGPGTSSPVRLLVTDKSSPTDSKAKKYFDGTVALNGTATVNSSAAGQSTFSADTYVHIYVGTQLRETVKIHTSCSAPLVAGEQFGAVNLVSGL